MNEMDASLYNRQVFTFGVFKNLSKAKQSKTIKLNYLTTTRVKYKNCAAFPPVQYLIMD